LPALAANQQRSLTYRDDNFDGRLGWHEVIIQPGANVRLANADVPTTDRSQELRVYPQDMLTSPLDVRSASAGMMLGAAASTTQQAKAAEAGIAPDQFAALITRTELSPLLLILTLLLALGLGAVHALSPGHGKTIVGAYLVGARGTARHALFLGLTVTVTHTIGVFVLGFVTLYLSRYIFPEQLFPWIGALSGAMVAVMGFVLFTRRLRTVRTLAVYDPARGHEPHSHSHGLWEHEHGPNTHTHLPTGNDGGPITWRSLLALGVSGGLLPCPSALLVMLSAISLGRIGYGLVLIVAFSIGLAGVLTGIGVLFVYGTRLLSRIGAGRTQRLGIGLRLLPLASALVVGVAGIVITGRALMTTGLIR